LARSRKAGRVKFSDPDANGAAKATRFFDQVLEFRAGAVRSLADLRRMALMRVCHPGPLAR
jgi:hypothetical protein